MVGLKYEMKITIIYLFITIPLKLQKSRKSFMKENKILIWDPVIQE